MGMVPTWKTKKGKTWKFMDAGAYNSNERETSWLGVGRQGGVENEKKIVTLGKKDVKTSRICM